MRPTGYRLRLAPFNRAWRVVVQLAMAALFVPSLVDPGVSLAVRLGSVAGMALAAYGLRVVLGPAVVVRPEGLRVYTWWPRRRDIAWYRIFAVEVVPGAWSLTVELNSGERFGLPVVEHVDRLYEQIEILRQRLDA